ncbi:MAG: hypothetical protein RR268_01705 [Kiritimatiellia bacterium]
MNANHFSKRGSALLIVLGLLSFLMISAVAFSISMRTEHAAAASYRRNLMARELLATALTDARATVESAMLDQSVGFDFDNPATHTIERLAPFKDPNGDTYGRLISSRNFNSTTGGATGDQAGKNFPAYLLDDQMMRHVPPYIASTVYKTLEVMDGTRTEAGNYYIDWKPDWKPVIAKIPEAEIEVGGSTSKVSESVIGRMAWAVINLSDSIDINGIGSFSKSRGLGLTGNEFAFGSKDTAVQADELYRLVKSSDSVNGEVSGKLPVFYSNADISSYTAQAKSSILDVRPDGKLEPFSWEHALTTDGDDYYSPFSVYSFWPSTNRTDEIGTSSSGASSKLACNLVTPATLAPGLSLASNITTEINKIVSEGSSLPENFTRLLMDYIDKDSVPTAYDYEGQPIQDAYANAAPTVENVPMISEVAYLPDYWKSGDTPFVDDLQKNIEQAFEKAPPVDLPADKFKLLKTYPNDLSIKIPEAKLKVALRSYMPGYSENKEGYSFEISGLVGVSVYACSAEDKKKQLLDKSAVSTAIKKVDLGAASGNSLFTPSAESDFTGGKPSVEVQFKKESIPVLMPALGSAPSGDATKMKVSMTFLVDVFFNAKTMKSGSTIPADLVPAASVDKANYPVSLEDRLSSKLLPLDKQYFRITRAVTAEFSLTWKIKETPGTDGKPTTYTGTLVFDSANDGDLKVELAKDETLELGGQQLLPSNTNGVPSYMMQSTTDGAWQTIDPRYNWLSPMVGTADTVGSYGLSDQGYTAFSSPHWVFINGESLPSADNLSETAEAYENAHSGLMPFSLGLKVADVRYGYNNTEKLLLPSEVGFLPVPLADNVWNPNVNAYRTYSFANYFNTVAKFSFFRTIPLVDFSDSAFSGGSSLDYEKCSRLCRLFQGFSGKGYPEEHRSIMSAFAGQDDYLLCQRLRQFAMMGIQSSIKNAAYVSYQRLAVAKDKFRITNEMLDAIPNITDVKEDDLTTAKYDLFICNYLFPLPENNDLASARKWDGRTRPKTVNFLTELPDSGATETLATKMTNYNDKEGASSGKLGQNDITTLLATAAECFGDRQQLFLYLLRADAIAYNSGRDLAQHKPLSTARAVALIWRDAYGKLPDRIIYYQVL